MRAHEESRRRFLGQLGVTAAAGLGLALAPSAAQAQPAQRTRQQRLGADAVAYHCCKNPGYCGSCPGGRVTYKCVATTTACSPNIYCTSCGADRGNCYDQFAC